MLYKKEKSRGAQYVSFLKEYFHVNTTSQLVKALREDLFLTIFLFSGSGLFSSVLKGLISRVFIKSGYPVLIGRRARIVHPSNIKFGSHIWLKDDVSIVANGRIRIGNNFVVGERATLWSDKKGLTIGNNVGVGKGCYIAQLGGPISIGDNVLLADSVRIYSLNHKYDNPKKSY